MENWSPADLKAACARLGEAVIDPAAWPSVMEEISRGAGATGAMMLQSDVRTADVPHTASIAELGEVYFREGWHVRDVRAARGVPRLLRGEPVITDLDLFTPEELRREPHYNEFLIPTGFQWFAVVGFRAGSALWGLSLQRTPKQGPFQAGSKAALAQLSRRLSEAATLSKAVSQAVLTGQGNALNLVRQPALVVDRFGMVLDVNAAAGAMFDDELRVHNQRLCVADRQARAALERFADGLRAASDAGPIPTGPIVVRRRDRPPTLIRILPIEPAARSPFLGARALLMLVDLEQRHGSDPRLLCQAFGLTPAEAKLAQLLSTGENVADAADYLRISIATARSQLRSIFSKTETRKQGALVALLARFGSHS